MKRLRWWHGVAAVVLMVLIAAGTGFAETPYVNQISKGGAPKDSLVLVTWNACNFGRSKKAETIHEMARILRDADIVALQEVSTSEFGAAAVGQLADELNRTGASWDYIVSNATIGPGTERFAFLFKTSKLAINRDKLRLAASFRDSLDREPAMLPFRMGNKVFTVVSFHLRPDERQKGKDPRDEVAAIGYNPQELLNGPMILVGDFNLGHRDLDGVFEGVLRARHNIEGKTSLKSKLGKNGEYLKNEFDNIYTRSITVYGSAIYNFVPRFTDLKQARQVSDHLPVCVVFAP